MSRVALPASPPASSNNARVVMRANRSRNTAPELALRRALHAMGLRYRVHFSPVATVRCQVDVVFRPARVAIFVDGCFWHSCPEHGRLPRANRSWWRQKLALNAFRDRRNDESLTQKGWHVMRIWEHEDMADAAARVALVVHARRQAASDNTA